MKFIGWRLAWVCAGGSLLACSGGEGRRSESTATVPTTMTASTTVSTSVGTEISASGGSTLVDGSGEGTTDKLDISESLPGCEFIDLLFVIDNSESMATYQQALADEFPQFIEATFDAVPDDIGIHVGITTTDFDYACDDAEATMNCQSTASLDDIMSHYVVPTDQNNGGNGSQGRLFQWSGQQYFEINSDDDPAPLEEWFSGAAVAAGEDGCSFEMPVAAAGFAAHPANAATNQGFIRDAGALLVVFFLTDEPDKSPESKDTYADMILDAKTECGGADCVFMGGLIPSCTLDVNQKLWQFMGNFGDDDPPWGDIIQTGQYSELFGEALAGAVAQACADLPVP